nr:hypothetical protein [Tanacetum cinerariifolium]
MVQMKISLTNMNANKFLMSVQNKTVGTDLDNTVGTDLSQSARTDLDQSAGTDLNQSAGTDLDQSAGTDIDQSAGTDLDQFDSFPGFNRRVVKSPGSESRPPMLNKENYVPWSSHLLRYAKSRPNGKLIHNSILNGPYVRKMIPEPVDGNRDITITETFHLQTDDELSDKELKQIEVDDQAIQTILLVDYTQLYDFLKYNQKEVDELKAKRLAKTQDPLALMAGQDRQMQIVGGNGGNQFRQYAEQNAGNPAGYNDVIRNQVIQNAVQNQNGGNQNGLIGVQGNGNQNQIGNGHYARNCTVRPKRRDATYLQTQLLIDLDEIKEVNANCILMANLQQASTSSTQTDSALVYDTDGSSEFMGTVRFGNDHVAAILGFGDLQ